MSQSQKEQPKFMGSVSLLLSVVAMSSCLAEPSDDELPGTVQVTIAGDCPDGLPPDPCYGCNPSPIVFDIAGDGFNLSGPEDGVRFALRPWLGRERVAWTTPNSDDAWLALDRNANGTIDDGTELFGNYTDQPDGPQKNGFRALAVYDSNSDGVIDANDPIYTELRLWQDANHDGVSQASELRPLSDFGVTGIRLAYTTTSRRDRHGNIYRYGAHITRTASSHVARRVYDVFLMIEATPISALSNEASIAVRQQATVEGGGEISGPRHDAVIGTSTLGSSSTAPDTERVYAGDIGTIQSAVCSSGVLVPANSQGPPPSTTANCGPPSYNSPACVLCPYSQDELANERCYYACTGYNLCKYDFVGTPGVKCTGVNHDNKHLLTCSTP